jgi:DNA-binding NarL/FixJ family response regulator
MPLKVLLAEDDTINRNHLYQVLGKTQKYTVYEAPDGRSTIRMATELKPDVIVFHVGMTNLNELEAIKYIQTVNPNVRMLGFSVMYLKNFIKAMLNMGAFGYIVEKFSLTEFEQALLHFQEGTYYLSDRIIRRMATEMLTRIPENHRNGKVDYQLLSRLSRGQARNRIAFDLNLDDDFIQERVDRWVFEWVEMN